MVKRTTGRVRKPAAPAGQAIVKQRSKAAQNKRAASARRSTGGKVAAKKAAPQIKTEDYEMEGIAAVMKDKGKVWFWVKWVDWPVDTNTWEPRENVESTEDFKNFAKVADLLEELDTAEPVAKGKKGKKGGKVDSSVGKQDNGEYEVEKVLGICWDFESSKIEYLIKWQGWPSSTNSWEPEENCNSPELLKPFANLADHLTRVWESHSLSETQSSGSRKPGPKSKTAPAAAKGKRGRKPAARSAATADETDDESDAGVKDEPEEEQNGNATDNDVTDDEAAAENGDGDAGDEGEDEETVTPKKRGRPVKKAAAKTTPAKRKTPAKKATPAKKRARR